MTNNILPIIAIIISLFSLALSIYKIILDRSSLRISCLKYDTQPPKIKINAVNIGRRPLVLYSFGAVYANGNVFVRLFQTYEMHMYGHKKNESQEHGRRLIEHDYFEEVISPDHDFYTTEIREGSLPISFWLEDTTGRRYRIPVLDSDLNELNLIFKKKSTD